MRKLLLFCLAALALPSLGMAQVINYSFAQQQAPYSEITAGTELGTAANDDETFDGLPIGFTFTFNGTAYTTFSASSNGYIVMGDTASAEVGAALFQGNGRALSSAFNVNTIAGFNMDLLGQATSSLTYSTLGTAPNRELVVQWVEYALYGLMGTISINFQIRLQEGTNTIRIHYGDVTTTTTAPIGAQVGLRGTIGDFNGRASTTSWATTTRMVSALDNVRFATGIAPASGLQFTYAPGAAPLRDIAARRILVPANNGGQLSATEPIRVLVRNVGGAAVDTVVGSYNINGVAWPAQTFVFSPALAVGDSGTLVFTATANLQASGTYRVLALARYPREGADLAGNDTARATFVSGQAVATLPYTENFASPDTLPAPWTVTTLRGTGAWLVFGPDIPLGASSGPTLSAIDGDGALVFPSYNSATNGALSQATSPIINLAAYPNDSLVLTVSYMRTGNFLARADSIQVRVSTDGGLTYRLLKTLFRNSNNALGSNEAEWAAEFINMTRFRGQDNLRLAFVAGGADGDNMAIDAFTLSIGSLVAARPAVAALQVRALPNPSTGRISLAGLPAQSVGRTAQLLDVSGKVIRTLALAEQLDLSDVAPGIYTLQAEGLRTKIVLTR